MACLPITDSASLSQTYYSGGGGGGSSGSQISSSGAYVLCSTNGVLVMGNTGAGVPDIQIGDTNNTVGISIGNTSGDTITLYNGSVTFAAQNVVMSSTNLNVSSINGAAPGAGGFFSTLSVPLPTQTSTVLMELPPGTWSYNGLATFTGFTNYLNGFANVAANSTPNYFGSIFPNDPNNTQNPGNVPCEMTLNIGDSGLSTIKLICANNSASLAGTWSGGVFKLF